MEYWYEIANKFDEIKDKNGSFSQSSVVILLIYLTFGSDSPSNMIPFFKNLSMQLVTCKKIKYNSNLCTPKIYTLLRRMKKDGLVIVNQNKSMVKPPKTYSINPRIIQSPIKSGNYFMIGNYSRDLPNFGSGNYSKNGTYFERDASPFEIPLKAIEQFLPWRDFLQYEGHKEQAGRDRFFKRVVYPIKIDFFYFMNILRIMAKEQKEDVERNSSCYYDPSTFEKQLGDYYNEIVFHRDRMIIKDCVSRIFSRIEKKEPPSN